MPLSLIMIIDYYYFSTSAGSHFINARYNYNNTSLLSTHFEDVIQKFIWLPSRLALNNIVLCECDTLWYGIRRLC